VREAPLDPEPKTTAQKESQPMSQYSTMLAFLLMVISPPLIPALVSVVHRSIGAVRAVADWRRAQPAAALP
jgi:hypothetical protein